ncbi:MAG: oligopeptide/dipeptide ABC transporter ATP-binding protein [Eubacteriales bacterium]
MSEAKRTIIETQDLKVYFRGKDKKSPVRAVDGVSFAIHEGETFGIVGESGCGKSTLGRAMLKLLPITDGTVVMDGKDLGTINKKTLKDTRKDMQIIFQDPSACLNPRRNIKAIISEPFQIHGITNQEQIDERILELVELVGLSEYHLTRFPHELSGGQKQRVGIARALALNPKFIVCDEAVSALDVSVQAQVLNLLDELQEKLGLTYMFISHNLNVVHHISDRVGVMYLGRIVEIADSNALYAKHYHPYTEALLSAIPQVDKSMQRERILLSGDVPSPSSPPCGCHFHTRCTKCSEECMETVPKLQEVEPGHYVACHLYNK